MRHLIIFTISVSLILLSACSSGEDISQSSPSIKSVDKRVQQYIDLMDENLAATTLLYSRLSPEVAKRIKPAKVPAEAKKVIGCLIDTVNKEGLNSEYDEAMKASREYVDYIKSTDSLTMLTMMEDPMFLEMQESINSNSSQRFIEVSKECGVMSMNIDLISQMGITEALKYMPEE